MASILQGTTMINHYDDAYLWGVAAYTMADSDLVALQIIAVGGSFFHVPGRRWRPYLATPVSFEDVRIRAFLLPLFHDNGT